MKKNNYSAPKMEQVRMEAEMPVMQTSTPSVPPVSAQAWDY